ncbi:MAG: hypothetical protein AAFY36_19310, partial [Bacteroidota bacterium]
MSIILNTMRQNFLLLLLAALSFLAKPLNAQSCEGSPGSVDFPNTICAGFQSDVSISGLDIPDGYEFQLYMTTGSTFDQEEIVYQSEFQAIFDDQLPPGNYFLYSAVGPAPIDPSDPCFSISPAFPFSLLPFELEDIPDTIFTTCDNPTATATWSNDSDIIYGFNASLDGISIVVAGSGNSFSTDTPGSYQILVYLGLFNCTRLYTFEVVNLDFVLPQVLTFDGSCDDSNTFCLSPYDPNQTYTLDGQILTDSCFAEPSGSGPFELEVERPGCALPARLSVSVNDPVLTIFGNTEDALCGESNGAVSLGIIGGTLPINISLQGFGTQTITDPDQEVTFSGLASGNYAVDAEDAQGCTGDGFIFIRDALEPLEATVSPSECPESSEGAITFTSDTSDLFFNWFDLSPNEETINRTGLSPGTYQVFISANNGCEVTQTFTVGSQSDLAVILPTEQIVVASCDTITVSPEVEGGIPPYTFEWDDGSMNPFILVSPSITNTYSFTVTDSEG